MARVNDIRRLPLFKERKQRMRKLFIIVTLLVVALFVGNRAQTRSAETYCEGVNRVCENLAESTFISCRLGGQSVAICAEQMLRIYNGCMAAHKCSDGSGPGEILP